MESITLDSVSERLNGLILQREQFQSRYDRRAGEFLDDLSGLFRLFHRLTFDLSVPPGSRQKAASIAVYIAESHDYCGEYSLGVEGLIDDLWLAYTGLRELASVVPIEVLQRHWRAEGGLFRALDLSREIQDLERHVPSRVLERLKAFIAQEGSAG